MHPKPSCDATDLVTDAHWNPRQRTDVYGTNASTREYAQKILLLDDKICCKSELTKHTSPMTDMDWIVSLLLLPVWHTIA